MLADNVYDSGPQASGKPAGQQSASDLNGISEEQSGGGRPGALRRDNVNAGIIVLNNEIVFVQDASVEGHDASGGEVTAKSWIGSGNRNGVRDYRSSVSERKLEDFQIAIGIGPDNSGHQC